MGSPSMKVLLFACLALALGSLAEGRAKIVGGEEAEPHEFPWQVSLRRKYDNFHFCGGSILNENTVVSAAHCTVIWEDPSQVVIVAGEHNNVIYEGTEQTVEVSKLVPNENYGAPHQLENDIALWHLATNLTFNEAVQAVPLPEPKQIAEGPCTVTGWGTLSAGAEDVEVTLVLEYIQRCPTSLNGSKKISNKTNNNSATSHKLKIMKNNFQINKQLSLYILF